VPDLKFMVDGVEPARFAVSPLLNFKLRIENAEREQAIQAIALRCQIRIEPTRRQYQNAEQQRIVDIFGQPERWSQTVHSMLWTHTNIVVPSFTGSTELDLPAPCTFDFNVASAKYFHALENGVVPLLLLFSGTVFYAASDSLLQVDQISWSKEANFDLPVGVWKQMMDEYYPNTAWLCLSREVFDRLHRYKMDRGLPTWEQTLESMLP
jgi:hypothetical protein